VLTWPIQNGYQFGIREGFESISDSAELCKAHSVSIHIYFERNHRMPLLTVVPKSRPIIIWWSESRTCRSPIILSSFVASLLDMMLFGLAILSLTSKAKKSLDGQRI
jgi:hypothetical protein